MRDSKRLLDLLPFLKTDEELENVDDMKRSVVIHQHIAGLIETKEHREALRFIAAIRDPDVRSQALEQFADSIDADERIVESEIADMLLDAFSTAREQNRATVWHYIGAFSGSMKRLGITSEVWERIMKVEAIVEEINASSGIQLRR
jgi:hypothetical protein